MASFLNGKRILAGHLHHGSCGSLTVLPNEVLVMIISYLNVPALYALIRTARFFSDLGKERLYQLALTHTIKSNRTLVFSYSIQPIDFFKISVLEWAALHDHADLFVALLDRGADYTAQVDEFYVFHHGLAGAGKKWALEQLLSRGANHSVKCYDRFTPLHYAAMHGQTDVMQLLIDAGADIGATSDRDQSPLTLAVQWDRVSAVQLLLSSGALKHESPFERFICFDTTLDVALRRGNMQIIKLLVEAGAHTIEREGGKVLIWAVEKGAKDLITRMLTIDPSCVFYQDEALETALMTAAFMGRDDILLQLIASRAPIDIVNGDRYTALHLAVVAGHVSTVRLLLHFGRYLSSSGWSLKGTDHTLLHMAAHKGDAAVVQELLDAGANPAAPDSLDNTPVGLAAARGHLRVLDLFAKADPTCLLGRRGTYTPLHAAIRADEIDVVEYLIAHEVDIFVTDLNGDTPLRQATVKENRSIMKLLIDAGAGAFIHEKLKGTRFYEAEKEGVEALTQLLIDVTRLEECDDIDSTAEECDDIDSPAECDDIDSLAEESDDIDSPAEDPWPAGL